MESPTFVRISLAAAITLGLRSGLFYRNAKLYCINLLMSYTSGCKANCAYCGLSGRREGEYTAKSFIRVEWPIYPLELILQKVLQHKNNIKRICIAMITNDRATTDLKTIISYICSMVSLPVSVLITPTIVDTYDIEDYKRLGADRIGIAIDAGTPELFDRYRGSGVNSPHDWQHYWQTVEKSVGIFGRNHVGVHLIVGLGETEKQISRTIQRVRDLGATTHLFSFYPEVNSQLENRLPPPVGQFRRIQLVRYLIDNNIYKYSVLRFNRLGQIVDFGLSQKELSSVIESGLPFLTSGCTDTDGNLACNRPYGDCAPGKDIRSFPFIPDADDIRRIKQELKEMGGR